MPSCSWVRTPLDPVQAAGAAPPSSNMTAYYCAVRGRRDPIGRQTGERGAKRSKNIQNQKRTKKGVSTNRAKKKKTDGIKSAPQRTYTHTHAHSCDGLGDLFRLSGCRARAGQSNVCSRMTRSAKPRRGYVLVISRSGKVRKGECDHTHMGQEEEEEEEGEGRNAVVSLATLVASQG